MSLADRLREEGRAEGLSLANKLREEGKAEGRIEERASMLLKLLQLRFGAASEDTNQRVRQATLDELEVMVERVLTAQSIEDVFASK